MGVTTRPKKCSRISFYNNTHRSYFQALFYHLCHSGVCPFASTASYPSLFFSVSQGCTQLFRIIVPCSHLPTSSSFNCSSVEHPDHVWQELFFSFFFFSFLLLCVVHDRLIFLNIENRLLIEALNCSSTSIDTQLIHDSFSSFGVIIDHVTRISMILKCGCGASRSF